MEIKATTIAEFHAAVLRGVLQERRGLPGRIVSLREIRRLADLARLGVMMDAMLREEEMR